MQAQASIFTNIKANDLLETKILFFFIEDKNIVRRWMDIEEKYMKEILPDSYMLIDVLKNVKRKPLIKNGLKPLYGLRFEDIDHFTNLVESKKFSSRVQWQREDTN